MSHPYDFSNLRKIIFNSEVYPAEQDNFFSVKACGKAHMSKHVHKKLCRMTKRLLLKPKLLRVIVGSFSRYTVICQAGSLWKRVVWGWYFCCK